eukprot:m.183827 g.183827  ORF g.183827 m.183827 type:complete len:115 (-) comp14701_c0_seq2:309-653(-)
MIGTLIGFRLPWCVVDFDLSFLSQHTHTFISLNCFLNMQMQLTDFDGDKYLNESDLQQTVALLCDNLEEEDLQLVTEKVLDEADLDSDRKLSYVEFEHVVSRAPDFVNTFKIRI